MFKKKKINFYLLFVSQFVSSCKQLKTNLCPFVPDGFIIVSNKYFLTQKFFKCKLNINWISKIQTNHRRKKNLWISYFGLWLIYLFFLGCYDFRSHQTPMIMAVIMYRWINIVRLMTIVDRFSLIYSWLIGFSFQ